MWQWLISYTTSSITPAGHTNEAVVSRELTLTRRTVALAPTMSLFGDNLCNRQNPLAKKQSPFYV
jgi:hypothetical protein